MYFLHYLLNRLNYKQFFYLIIPLSSVLLGSMYSLSLGNTFPSKDFFNVILLQLIAPYLGGVIGLLWFSIYKPMNNKQNQHNAFIDENRSLADMLNMEVMNFEYYSKTTFVVWIIYLVPLIYNILV